MINIKQALSVTPIKIRRKSNYCGIQLLASGQGKDRRGNYYLFVGFAIDSQSQFRYKHKFFIKRYGGRGSMVPLRMICDCENFTYTWEAALKKYGSSVKYRSNGRKPRITNPRMKPGICKHLIAALKATQRLAPTKPIDVKLPKSF